MLAAGRSYRFRRHKTPWFVRSVQRATIMVAEPPPLAALKNAPGFDKKSWPGFADPNFTAKIEVFYSSRAARTSSAQAR